MAIAVCAGIDVASAKGKRLPVCFAAKEQSRLLPLRVPPELGRHIPRGIGNGAVVDQHAFTKLAEYAADAVIHIAGTMGWDLQSIAIDAPAAAPTCGVRASERDLNGLNLSAFQTPDHQAWLLIHEACRRHLAAGGELSRLPHANKIWMLYGFEIFKTLRSKTNAEVIEVYPFAIINEIARGCPHKSTVEGYQRQLEAIAEKTGWAPSTLEASLKACVPGAKHDRLDAFLSAWIASLPRSSRRCYGIESDPNDSIWIPRLV